MQEIRLSFASEQKIYNFSIEILSQEAVVALGCAWSNSYASLVLSKPPACIDNSIDAR